MARKPAWPRVFHNLGEGDVQYVLIFEKFYLQTRKDDGRCEVVARNNDYVNEALREWEQNDRVHEFMLIFP